jgi:cytoskeleton protein RodZ
MTSSGGQAAATETTQFDPGAAEKQTPGAMLQQERARLGLSVQQAAEGLHLDPWIVEAIEANRFVQLGAPVYAKGYLRKYAELLGLAPEVVIARYQGLSDTPEVPTPVPVITTAPPTRPNWPKYLVWTLLAAALIAGGTAAVDWWLNSPAQTGRAVEPPPITPAAEEAQPIATPVNVDSEPAASESDATSAIAGEAVQEEPVAESAPQAAEEASAAPEPAPATAAASSQTQLTLEFRDASWVEAYDADGRRLMFDIGQAGRTRTLEGRAPLNVVIGVADAVKVQVNGEPVVVPRRANRESTRFVVNADGTIR